ncbi:MAG TPA: AAA family ATPase [Candidatus Limnocylindria bacterium]|jgi:pilus assembly protein CpaE|nr:AAA family ATPase [Candidatus Limnocylindria bacterium]
MNKPAPSASGTSVAVLDPRGGDRIAAIVASERDLHLVSLNTEATAFVNDLDAHAPDVAIVESAGIAPDGLVDVVKAAAGRTDLIVIGDQADAPTLSRAVRAGARAFLVRPYDPEDLIATIGDLRSTHRDGVHVAARPSGGGSVHAVYAPKGGAGATTVATALGVALAEDRHRRVALVDLDLQFGAVGVTLDVKGQNTLSDLLVHGGALDQGLIDDTFVTHSSGLRVLLAPTSLASAAEISDEAVLALINGLRPYFDVIVIDLPSGYDERVAAVLAAADRVILVTTPELPALRDLQRVLEVAPALQNGKADLVLNRWPSRWGVPPTEVEKALGKKVALAIPSEGASIVRALNSGIAVVDRRAGVRSKAFRDLTRLVARPEKAQ